MQDTNLLLKTQQRHLKCTSAYNGNSIESPPPRHPPTTPVSVQAPPHPGWNVRSVDAETSDDSWDRKQETENGETPYSTSGHLWSVPV